MPTTLDLMEYANDAAAQAAFVTNAANVSQYPTHDADHVKATTTSVDYDYKPYYATDPAKSLTGTLIGNGWLSTGTTNQRFHVDLGSEKVIIGVYYENSHSAGGNTLQGAKDFILQGAADDANGAAAFAELTYAIDTNWTQLTIDPTQMVEHVALDQTDPRYIVVTNTIGYRYCAFKFANSWDAGYAIGMRRIVLLTAPSLQDYSEATIKQEGSYSLKGVALITDSLNKTLTRTVSPTIDLSNKTVIRFDVRASRTGANIKIGIHDSGDTTTEITPNIAAVDTWQTIVWDISVVANANKDAIDSIIVTIVNADAENTFYIDNMFADVITSYLIYRGRDRFRTTGISVGT